MAAAPVQLDPINSGQWAAQYSSFQKGPAVDGQNLYALLTDNTGFEMMKSTDGGLTWTVMDAANAPATGGGSGFFDGLTHTFWAAYADGANQLGVASFDTTNDTWTSVATGGPSTGLVYGCAIRSDGSLFVCYSGAAGSQLEALSFDTGGGTFGGEFDAGAGILALPEYSVNVAAGTPTFCLSDSLDDVYIVFRTTDGSGIPLMQNGVFFQLVDLANTLGNFFSFPGQIGNPPPDPPDMRTPNGPFTGPPVACGPSRIFLGIARVNPIANTNHAAGYVSTDAGASWTEITTPNGIDPGVSGSNFCDNCQFAPFSYFDGVVLTVIYAQVVSCVTPAGAIRITTTTPDFLADPNTWTWTAKTAITITQIPGMVSGTDGFSFPMYSVLLSQPTISTDILDLNTFTLAAWFIPIKVKSAARIFGTFVGSGGGGVIGGTK